MSNCARTKRAISAKEKTHLKVRFHIFSFVFFISGFENEDFPAYVVPNEYDARHYAFHQPPFPRFA